MLRLFIFFSALVLTAGMTVTTSSAADAGPRMRKGSKAPAKAKPRMILAPDDIAGGDKAAARRSPAERGVTFTCSASPHSGKLLATGNVERWFMVHLKAHGRLPAQKNVKVVVHQPDGPKAGMSSNICTSSFKKGVVSTTVNFPPVKKGSKGILVGDDGAMLEGPGRNPENFTCKASLTKAACEAAPKKPR